MERFWSKVDASGDCWEWTAGVNNRGYGYFHVAVGQSPVGAHRFAYEQLVGPIPDGLVIDHLCRNPPCVNPDHLEPVRFRENLMRGGVGVKNRRGLRKKRLADRTGVR